MYIKRNGSRIIRLIVLIIAILIALLIAILMLAFSQAFQDWTYDKLPNGYEIWRINSEDISLLKTDGDSSDLRIDRYILEFCYNDSYIGIKRLMIDENLPYQEAHIEDMDASNPSYYLVDTVNAVSYTHLTLPTILLV